MPGVSNDALGHFRNDESEHREFVGIARQKGRASGGYIALFRELARGDGATDELRAYWPHEVRRMAERLEVCGTKPSQSVRALAALGLKIIEAPPPHPETTP